MRAWGGLCGREGNAQRGRAARARVPRPAARDRLLGRRNETGRLHDPPGMPSNSSCQDVGFICPFEVIDPTDLGATTAVARSLLQDSCLTISYLSPTQNPCLFTLWN